MIFCFSGTGNSLAIAQKLALLTKDDVCICKNETPTPYLNNEKILGLVFPVYAWGMPIYFEKFISRILEQNKNFHPEYTFFVCTCGDDIGKTDVFVEELLGKYQIALHAKFSIIMPNTYVALPGFDVDSKNITKEKLKAAHERARHIATSIRERRKNVSDIHPGKFPWIKSYLLRPIFNKLLTSPRHFKVNKKRCIGCNICLTICPTKNISMSSIPPFYPHWNNHCANCLACYHHCPQHCISYGRYSNGKGQYLYKTSSIGISHFDTGKDSNI